MIVLPSPFRLFGSTKLDGCCATVHGGPAHCQVPITIQVSYSNSDNFRVESESATVTGKLMMICHGLPRAIIIIFKF